MFEIKGEWPSPQIIFSVNTYLVLLLKSHSHGRKRWFKTLKTRVVSLLFTIKTIRECPEAAQTNFHRLGGLKEQLLPDSLRCRCWRAGRPPEGLGPSLLLCVVCVPASPAFLGSWPHPPFPGIITPTSGLSSRAFSLADPPVPLLKGPCNDMGHLGSLAMSESSVSCICSGPSHVWSQPQVRG